MEIALAILTNRYVMIPLLAIAMLFGVYTYGKSVARGECHDAQLRAQIASMQRDISAAQQASEVERAQSNALIVQRQQLESQVKDYEAALKSRPDPACTLSDDDVRALGGVPVQRRK
mgnify:CR=1 FL=1